MADSVLTMHAAGELVTLDQVNAIPAPPATRTWFPLPHGYVLQKVKDVLGEAGFVVRGERFGLSHENARFFAVLDLVARLADGVSLAVGVRNSVDRSFPIGFCAGSRVFVCSNLAFRSDLLVRKKHTRHGATRFADAIGRAMTTLKQFQAEEGHRITYMRATSIDDAKADSLILRSFESGIINSHALPGVIKHWRDPEHEDFRPRTLWSLFNSYTSALGKRADANLHAYAAQTMRLTGHLTRDIPRPEIPAVPA